MNIKVFVMRIIAESNIDSSFFASKTCYIIGRWDCECRADVKGLPLEIGLNN